VILSVRLLMAGGALRGYLAVRTVLAVACTWMLTPAFVSRDGLARVARLARDSRSAVSPDHPRWH
jgi:hypothetical protein